MSLPTPYYEDKASGITIYCADNKDVLPHLPDCELVITDPPFSEYTHKNAKSNRDVGHGNKAIDFKAIDFKAISETFRLCGNLCKSWLISFLDWRHIAQMEINPPEPWEFVRFGVWVKTNPMPQISADRPANGWDGIAYLHHKETTKEWNGGGNHGNWIGPVITNGTHPTAKPIGCLLQMIERFTIQKDLVIDPFMGSGTALFAAKQLGRRAIGCEIDETYCASAKARLEQDHFVFRESVERLRQEVLITV